VPILARSRGLQMPTQAAILALIAALGGWDYRSL
jgi:hypothetical protein